MSEGRVWEDLWRFDIFAPLWQGEMQLASEYDLDLRHLWPERDAAGEPANLPADYPQPAPYPWVRATFLEHLLALAARKGSGETNIDGFTIRDPLRLQSHPQPLVFDRTQFNDGIFSNHNARLVRVSFSGCRIESGVFLEGVDCEGGLTLERCAINGAIRLVGAKVGGELRITHLNDRASRGEDCQATLALSSATIKEKLTLSDCNLRAPDATALDAHGLKAETGVALHNVSVAGTTKFAGARIKGDIVVDNSAFSAKAATALDLNHCKIDGDLRLPEGVVIRGNLDLSHARCVDYVDDPANWPRPGRIALDGFEYERLVGRLETTDASSIRGIPRRIDWLTHGRARASATPFAGQPFEFLAAKLRLKGDVEGAKEVLIEKERSRRASTIGRMIRRGGAWGGFTSIGHEIATLLLDQTIRFGHRPLRAVGWLVGLWLFGAALFFAASRLDAIAPNDPQVIRSPAWIVCAAPQGARIDAASGPLEGRAAPGQSQRDCWEAQPEGASWLQFNAPVYSLDALLPIVDLGMQGAWAPDETKNGPQWWTRIGEWAKIWLWLHIALGWSLSLLAVAGFSGLVKSD